MYEFKVTLIYISTLEYMCTSLHENILFEGTEIIINQQTNTILNTN